MPISRAPCLRSLRAGAAGSAAGSKAPPDDCGSHLRANALRSPTASLRRHAHTQRAEDHEDEVGQGEYDANLEFDELGLGAPAQLCDRAEHECTLPRREDVRHLVEQEFARTAEDILWRRTKLGLSLNAAEQRALAEYLETGS